MYNVVYVVLTPSDLKSFVNEHIICQLSIFIFFVVSYSFLNTHINLLLKDIILFTHNFQHFYVVVFLSLVFFIYFYFAQTKLQICFKSKFMNHTFDYRLAYILYFYDTPCY